MLNSLTACFIFLIATQWSPCFSGDAIAVADPLAAKITAIKDRMAGFVARDYDEEADRLARITITEVLACPERDLSAAENAALVDAFLKTELFQAFNTRFGSTRTHDHRIVYDFLQTLDKVRAVSDREKAHLTKLTVLSLAAQEFFWNSNSTVLDLKRRVMRELRFGLFRQADNPLNVSRSIYLPGDDLLGQIIDAVVTDELRGTLNTLLTQFLKGGIGNIYTALLASLTEEQTRNAASYAPLALSSIPRAADFGIVDGVRAAFYPSSGMGVQCGFNSLFVPTENAVNAAGPRTAREKMIRSLEDDVTDPILRRFYLFNSSFSDLISFERDLFNPLVARLKAISGDALKSASDREKASEAASRLEAEKVVFDSRKKEIQELREQKTQEKLEEIKRKVIALKAPITAALEMFERSKAERMETWRSTDAFRRLGISVRNLGLGKIPSIAIFFEEPYISRGEVLEFFKSICQLVGNEALGSQMESFLGEYADFTLAIGTHCENLIKNLILSGMLPLVEVSDPGAVSNEELIRVAKTMASQRGIDYLLECAEPYVQQWAMRNNLNIVVFSDPQAGEFGGLRQPPLECLVRSASEDFSQSVIQYAEVSATGKIEDRKIATVILTSPTAKTLYLTKSPGHYDKLIAENDLAALARQIRQTALMNQLIPPIDLSAFTFDFSSIDFSSIDLSNLKL